MPHLQKVTLHQFRNFTQLDFTPARGINLILGENGSGKTSLLEALHFACRGRSFRSGSPANLIHNKEPQARVDCVWETQNTQMQSGVTLSRGSKTQLLWEGKALANKKDLLKRIPFMLIGPHNLDLISCPPAQRRAFLNGILFHLVPDYVLLLKDYQHSLNSRNAQLNIRPRHAGHVRAWDKTLVRLGESLEKHRRTFIQKIFLQVTERLADWNMPEITLEYFCGWDENKPLEQALAENMEKDFSLGRTSAGCHRADIKVSCGGQKASTSLSLGQNNMASLAFFCAAYIFLKNALQTEIVFALDDIIQRLDHTNRQFVLSFLREHQVQALVTGSAELPHWKAEKTDRRWRVQNAAVALAQ